MARAFLVREIHCEANDEVGFLGRVVIALAQQNVSISHLSAYTAGETGYLQFIVREVDVDKAKEAVGYFIPKISVREALIVEFENKVGTLAPVAKLLGSNGIGINYVYGTSSDGFKIVGVFSTTDNQKASELINQDSGWAINK
ncbi:MAG: hypothetical protein A3G33_02900 [Omnitrophica bacterium RIFCSPLOWO2_12_FULL_44_17]|uniref:ACT domain-containing protein n=1 Tax=Candidatus Danuiimicrobium aquiferis TaxID=1801832 RepID=A0A1G1KVJ9_9BACT|nr:MAG: hypothetical protein A3B72_04380 [Omnitrophica bacterium RIFCSPHIGHO2_02_FULL_45_28]OGW96927.1 MAG: hypothetical protein A3G33_02900 [Omnitrophica bacterium RIFCSPLOWO2_12_FULL_44_17]OGX03937.1 MAG: hypothetical protein A3J12_03515 [Omnitrophica bacterium RIFCSPLOWO2_02_FULL_44_11]